MKKPQLCLFLLLLLFSCMTPPVYYETFFTDDGNLQYYMRKASLKGNGISGEVDFTIRIGDNSQGDATFNCSVIVDTKKRADSIFFLVDGQALEIKELDVIYIKRAEKKQRYTGIMSDKDFFTLLGGEEIALHIMMEGEDKVLLPTKKFTRAKEALHMEIME